MTNNSQIFKAYDIRGKVGADLTEELVEKVGGAFANWLPTTGTIAVGRDMRPDSAALGASFIRGLRSQGRHVLDIGQVTTDMVYFAVGKFNLAGGAVITASHNPGDDNGIKLYRDQVIAVGLDSGLAEIRDLVLSNKLRASNGQPGGYEQRDITQDWVEHCMKFVGELKPFKIAIDAGNGMAGAILPNILPRLPLEAEQMFFELDGTFPNHEANPQKPENLQPLIKRVLGKQLDFGVAFDGDGDRAGFVDDKGRPVLGTDLITIAASLYLKKYPGAEIVHDVRTSRATEELIREWGGKPVRAAAGRVVIGTVMRQRHAPFGGETTGHLFFKENYFADSGLITALVIMQAISQSGRRLSELIDEYRRYAMLPEINFIVADKAGAIAKLKEIFADGQQDELDGLTVNYPDKWLNIRLSNTEPLLRLNAEARDQQVLDNLVRQISKLIDT